MTAPRLSLRHACLFMENAFLDLLDILAWQEGTAPRAGTLNLHRGEEAAPAETGAQRTAARR